MNRPRNRRSSVTVSHTRRLRPQNAASRLGRADRHPSAANRAGDEAALALLSEILVGDGEWTLGEVRRLISMRESAELGRWRATEPDGRGQGAP